ncbi:alpha/beta fold hydrolase [Vallitalea okinawensis]|uniref:alpha/beta fold hydrolase n=1 Tax=Vallitalea okinawensis TaxID=2078660 RepID=UPI000CFD7C27|nr:alpha/beta hydrolase [Vallitalea okinawensis]
MSYYMYHGKKIYYEDKGQGSPLLILPGDTASSAVHGLDIEFYSQYYRVFCPDYLGYGKSDRVDRLPTNFWWENAKMLREFIEDLGLSDVLVIGTSGGGITALALAILAKDKIAKVVADSLTGEVLNEEEIKNEVKSRQQKTEGQIGFWSYAQGDDWESVVNLDSDRLLRMAESGSNIYNHRLDEIKCPVLLTGSKEDDLLSHIEDDLSKLAIKINGAEVLLYPSGNHPAMWSNADRFRKDSIEFF